MPTNTWLLRAIPLALLAVIPCSAVAVESPGPVPEQDSKSQSSVDVEIRCVDDSVLKLKVLDAQLEVITKFGTLQIPIGEVRRIEFASRTPPEVLEKIHVAIGNLNHPEFTVREQATAELKAYRERAYFPVLKATKSSDPEVSRRADDAVRFIQARVPAGNLDSREYDVIQTEDCKITGRINNPSLRVITAQFGEQQLKLSDARTLKAGSGIGSEDIVNAATAPPNLMAFQNQYGKEATYSVTGATPGAQGTGLWGTDTYTLDSSLAAAVVHSGLIQPGQTGVVRVRIIASPPQFVGSQRNGFGSSGYATYPAGAFEFVRK
jgi:hypothetical protein